MTGPLRSHLAATGTHRAAPRPSPDGILALVAALAAQFEGIHPKLHVAHRQPIQPPLPQVGHDIEPAEQFVVARRGRRQTRPHSLLQPTGENSDNFGDTGATGPRRDACVKASHFACTSSRDCR